jgi:PEP-CTERM putative exosortase interaction domain
MKRLTLITTLCFAGAIAQAQLIDDFSGNLSAYTATRILNNDNHSPGNTYAWEISGGALRINTSSYVGIEQFALTRTDFSLSVGYELTASYIKDGLNQQDIGLYVGAGTPTTDVRADYVSIYVRNNDQIYSRGFNGATELSLSGGGTVSDVTALFIARTGLNDFELGYYVGSTRTVLTTRTMDNSSIGSSIGFYADIREAGIRGAMDNLTLSAIPEPGSMSFLILGGAGFLMMRRFNRGC